jgi:limonene-1,2-epoxide hydrolase
MLVYHHAKPSKRGGAEQAGRKEEHELIGHFPSTVETGLAYVTAYNAQDPVALRALYTDDFYVENALHEGRRGPDEVVKTISTVWKTLPGARFDLRNVVAQENTVALEFFFSWQPPQGADGTVPARPSTPVVDVFQVRDGKLAALRAYFQGDVIKGWLEQMSGQEAVAG